MSAPRIRSAFIQLETALVGAILTIIALVVVVQLSSSYRERVINRDAYHKLVIDAAAARYLRETGRWPSADLKELVDEGYLEKGVPKSPFPPHEPYRFDLQTHRAVGNSPPLS